MQTLNLINYRKPSIRHIPPGHGKPATQSRNARRRKKREFERAALSAPSAPLAGASAANATPLGILLSEFAAATDMELDTPAPTEAPPTNSDQPDMFSLSNKNKRRGFKRSMAETPPQRITFDDPVPGPSSTPPVPSASRPASPTKPPRLIPPSEKAALGLLPPGMFVTSVDVEEGMWPAKNFDKKRKKKQRDAWGVEDELEYIPAGRAQAQEVQEGDWDGALPYDEDEGGEGLVDGEEGGMSKAVKEEMLDWADLEARFDGAKPIVPENLQVGSVVAWKVRRKAILTRALTEPAQEFGVHPVRLTPEMVVHAATVHSVNSGTGKISVQVARREVAFGMLDEDEGEPESEVVEYDLGALGQLSWKSL